MIKIASELRVNSFPSFLQCVFNQQHALKQTCPSRQGRYKTYFSCCCYNRLACLETFKINKTVSVHQRCPEIGTTVLIIVSYSTSSQALQKPSSSSSKWSLSSFLCDGEVTQVSLRPRGESSHILLPRPLKHQTSRLSQTERHIFRRCGDLSHLYLQISFRPFVQNSQGPPDPDRLPTD